MSVAPVTQLWEIDGNVHSLEGYGFGSRYPVATLSLRGRAMESSDIEALDALLLETVLETGCGGEENREPDDPFCATIQWIVGAVYRLQKTADLPVYERGGLLEQDGERARIFIPVVAGGGKAVLELLKNILELIDCRLDGKPPHKTLKRLALVVAEIRKSVQKGSNVRFFVQAAFDMGMPFRELPSRLVQYGQGMRGRWMHSSFSEETSLISARTARNKMHATAILRRAGIPVPEHKMADTEGRAERIAEQFGYPVVIKPADLDGGVGVSAGLQNRGELVRAFNQARRASRSILVEKHVEGRDYRITVFRGEVVSAVERVPGGVTGDGRHTVRELLERLNAEPLRGAGRNAQLKQVAWDNEAIALLEEAGLEANSVPVEGRFVRLRRTANLATGGTPVRVLDRMHPDNRRLAVRAARILRLDIAGIDLLMPDIGRSWREAGGVVCEVNAQPSLGGQTVGGTLYAPILRALVPAGGRIPVVLVLGADASVSIVRAVETALLEKGITVGCRDADGVRIGGDAVRDGYVEPLDAGEMFVIDNSVEAIVLAVDDDSVLFTGLPFARFDMLVLAGTKLGASERSGGNAGEDSMREVLRLVLPACDGRVAPLEGAEAAVDGCHGLTPGVCEAPVSRPQAIENIVSKVGEMLAADENAASASVT
ncbi:hypothetical protein CHL67_06200 [Prosthecochloris sp. GSB1]|uniref:ATP-binding protein n=1 Tax=Prosthecochloris sp. GSB1 TaxID=281093 RepID=UPI000B8CFFB8|nr:acetate--CoA ligase family protein [Prosthecochloris sp. GSB1]ASQ90567.1 hypothetical protein CHL67_06200 [Prosthecochloris sp. GSB1]